MMECGYCGEHIEVGERYVLRGNGDTWSVECFEELGEAYIEKYDDYAYKINEDHKMTSENSRDTIIAKWDGMTPRERDAWVFYDALRLMPLDTMPNDFGGFGTIPNYTTDISAAWTVVDKLREDWLVQLRDCAPFGWHVGLLSDHEECEDMWNINADHVTEAICLAALIAKLCTEE